MTTQNGDLSLEVSIIWGGEMKLTSWSKIHAGEKMFLYQSKKHASVNKGKGM